MLRPFSHRIRVLVATLAAAALCVGLAFDATAAKKKKAKKAPATKVESAKSKGKTKADKPDVKPAEPAKPAAVAPAPEPPKPVEAAKPAPAAKTDVTGLWNAECKKCHGADGKGKPNKTSDMTTAAWQKSLTDAQIRKAIADGFERERNGTTEKMKGLKDSTPAKLDGLVAYVRSLAK